MNCEENAPSSHKACTALKKAQQEEQDKTTRRNNENREQVEKKRENQEMRNTTNQVISQQALIREEIQEAQTSVHEQQTNLNSTQQQVETLKAKFREKDEHIKQRDDQINKLIEENKALKKQVDETRTRLDNLTSDQSISASQDKITIQDINATLHQNNQIISLVFEFLAPLIAGIIAPQMGRDTIREQAESLINQNKHMFANENKPNISSKFMKTIVKQLDIATNQLPNRKDDRK